MSASLGTAQMSNELKRRKYGTNAVKNGLFEEEYCMGAILESQSMKPRMA